LSTLIPNYIIQRKSLKQREPKNLLIENDLQEIGFSIFDC
jgi:hypothetical protein